MLCVSCLGFKPAHGRPDRSLRRPHPEARVPCKRPIMHRRPRSPLLDLLDFHLALLQIARKTSFACWIFVGFRARLNPCSYSED